MLGLSQVRSTEKINCIRQLIAAVDPGNQLIVDNARHQLEVLQGRRDALVLADVSRQKRGVVDFKDMISLVVASGLLRSATYLRDSFTLALNVCVKDSPYRKFLLCELDKHNFSASSIGENRLKIHMALCVKMQDDLEEVANAGAYMVFRTLDLTPERGMEWVLFVGNSWKVSHSHPLKSSLTKIDELDRIMFDRAIDRAICLHNLRSQGHAWMVNIATIEREHVGVFGE